MYNHPLVSVIVPYYNHGEYIEECINSILASTYLNIEVVVVNDGSTGTFSIQKIKELEGKHNKVRIYHQENGGPSLARNTGMEIAKGDFFVFLDGDDLIEKNTISICMDVFNSSPETTVVYGNNLHFGEKNVLRKQKQLVEESILLFNTIAVCVMIKRTFFDQEIKFDLALSKLGLEDWELWITLVAKGFQFKYINQTLFKIRVLKNSRTTDSANQKLKEIKAYIFKKHALFLAQKYEELFYLQKQTLETPDYRIGNTILKPYRWFK